MKTRGTIGGQRGTRIYVRSCPSHCRDRQGGTQYRVFFTDEACLAQLPPCAVCMAERYREWKATGLPADVKR